MKTEPAAINIKDIPEIAIRRRWLIVVPLCAAAVAGLYLAFTTPKVYEASTLIFIQPQQVPREFVRSVVAEDMNARVTTIKQQIMSRTNLERIINDHNLYADAKAAKMFMEDKIANLGNAIDVEVTRSSGRGSDTFSFLISFRGTDPQKVMRITNTLANNFIDANIRERETSAMGTGAFLADELENTRNRLEEMESRLKDYRQQFMGELPEQLTSNLAILQRLQDQLNAKEDGLRSIRLSLSMLEKQIEEARKVSSWDPQAGRADAAAPQRSSNDPEVLRGQLADLLTRYTDRHPDITNLKKKIAEIESQQASAEDRSASKTQKGALTAAARYTDPLGLQRAQLLKERMATEAEIADLTQQIQFYQARVESTPKREQEMVTLKRDYDNLSELYRSLLNRKLEAEISVSLERKQKGEQFQVIDYARLPKKPVAPDLRKIFLMSIALGLGIGCGLAYVFEFLQSTYRKPEEIETSLGLPVIAAIPPILTRGEINRRRVELSLCGVVSLITLALIGVFSLAALAGTNAVIDLVRKVVNL